MAWPALTANDVMPGEPTSDSADTVGQQLFDRDIMLLNKGTTYAFALQTTAALTPGVMLVSKQVYIPAAMESGDSLYCSVEIWNSGANTTFIKLYDLVSATDGPTLLNNTGTTHKWIAPRIVLGAWGGTFRTIEVWGYVSAGTGSYLAEDLLANMWFVAQ